MPYEMALTPSGYRFFERNKEVKTYLLSERLAPPSGKFSATAPSFFAAIM